MGSKVQTILGMAVFSLLINAFLFQTAVSQTTLTEDQQRIFQQLPASQREALMKSMGIDPGQQEGQSLEFPETVIQAEPVQPEEPELRRLEPGDTIIVRLDLPEDLEISDRRELEKQLQEDERLNNLRGSRTYSLNGQGMLVFPGIASIRLAGLSEEEAASRLTAEKVFDIFEADVLYLPLAMTGQDALEPFGYLLFKGVPVTFAPATDIPVPADYVVGPGDEVRVQLFGNVDENYSLVVNRDGSINFPDVGPVDVAGLNFADMKEVLQARVAEQMIGVRASITLGELRSIRVFVLGDVNRPGSFTVSSLSTMTNALFVSGGVNPIGSLRNIQLKRKGKIVGRMDLYDLMLRGDNSSDARLQPGDVIFIPPIGSTVAVSGGVRRPAIYELKNKKTLGEVIELAGGFVPTAYPEEVRVKRINRDRRRSVLVVDLSSAEGRAMPVMNGDAIQVDSVLDEIDSSVVLSGHVQRPGAFQWYQGMRLTDVLPSTAHLSPHADRHYVLIRREVEAGGPIDVLSVDFTRALSAPQSDSNPILQQRDTIFVFDLESGRATVIDPLLEELRLQAQHGSPSQQVGIGGKVREPGAYPLEAGMRVSDLVRAGANLTDSAYALSAELTRYTVRDSSVRTTELIEIDLQSALAGDDVANVFLKPFDYLNIKEVSLWREQAEVEIRGEVLFPGIYAIEPGETLSSVIKRAGGLTDFAFVAGSVFLREELKDREREQMDRLAARLESDLASMALQAARFESAGADSVSLGQSLLGQLRSVEPVGRLVIDLESVVAGNDISSGDVLLRDGDILIVPEKTQEVTVIGEVQYSTSHIFSTGLDRDRYIGQSGGLTANADEKRIYIVKATGAVSASSGKSKWFRRSGGRQIDPGDTIVVPMDVDRMPKLLLWQSATSILFNLAIATAAVASL
jgi:polysaccharide export outer membrane protein